MKKRTREKKKKEKMQSSIYSEYLLYRNREVEEKKNREDSWKAYSVISRVADYSIIQL